MRRSGKLKTWLTRILVAVAMLIVLVLVVSPRLINLEMVRSQVKTRMSRDVGAEIKYRKMVLSYLPRPHIVIHNAEVRIPDGFTITVHRMRFYPKILPLFRGILQVSSVKLEYADYFMKLPQISKTEPPPNKMLSVDAIIRELARAIQDLPEFRLPDVRLYVKYGKVNLVDPFGRRFLLRELHADYHSSPDKLDFSIQCKSNLWDQIEINGFLNPTNFIGRGKIELSRVRPRNLLAYLMPESKLQVIDTRASLRIDFESQGVGSLKANFDGAVPFLELGNGTQKLAFKGGRLRGTIGIGDQAMAVNLTKLSLDYPELTATGMFSYNENLDEIQLSINGFEINADSVRQMTLALADESEIVANIFDIIRGGYVPWMSVQTQGHSMADLGRLENIVIKGNMTRGKIFIPGAELDLEDVFGDAVIAGGILNGDNLQARMGSTSGQNGSLRLGLNEAIAPLQLKIGIEADLAQLPAVLNRIVNVPDFNQELTRISEVEGSASGRLILGDDLKSLGATVEVSKAEFRARYNRIPYPIKLAGGRFVYEGSRIAIDKFDAEIGQSRLKQFSSAIDWSQTPTFGFKSQSASLNLAEIYAWLQGFENYQKMLQPIRTMDGNVAVTELAINGPMFNPPEWKFISRGDLDDIQISSSQLPHGLRIATGRFSWQPAEFTLADVFASLGKSTVSNLSANFKLKKQSNFDLQSKSAILFAGEIYPWLASLERFKPALADIEVSSGKLTLHDLVLGGSVQQPDRWHYQVNGDLQNLVVASDAFEDPITVNNGRFELTTATGIAADGPDKKIKIDPTKLTWGDSRLTVKGNLALHSEDIILDSDISADEVSWNQVNQLLDYIEKKGADLDRSGRQRQVIGALDVFTDRFKYDSLAIRPLRAEISFQPQKVNIAIRQASMCGVDISGLLDIYQQTLEMNLVPKADDQNLSPSLSCITDQDKVATGTYSLNGKILSKGKPDAFLQSLSGNAAFTAKEGRIYRFGLLAKLLSVLNVTEIYRGEIPDLTGEGFAYRSMTANAEIKDGKLIMQECSLDGVSMGIACEGNIDLVRKKMNLIILVAPFKTIDRIVEITPLVGHVLGGKLVSIPFSAKGDLKDPDVIPLAPMAVGSEVLGILERTLKLPITIIQPIFSGDKSKEKDNKKP